MDDEECADEQSQSIMQYQPLVLNAVKQEKQDSSEEDSSNLAVADENVLNVR